MSGGRVIILEEHDRRRFVDALTVLLNLFVRGDANAHRRIMITELIGLLSLLEEGHEPADEDDADDDDADDDDEDESSSESDSPMGV